MSGAQDSTRNAGGPSSPDTRKAYIGFQDCGCPVAAMVAGYDTVRNERAELRRWVKDGYRIEVMDPEEAKKLPGFLHCPHRQKGFTATADLELDGLMKKARGSS